MSPQPLRDILLVEDNPDDAELTTIGLEIDSWRVLTRVAAGAQLVNLAPRTSAGYVLVGTPGRGG